ncbi:integrase/recombinase XerD [Methanococcus voltae PS]|uniref:Integrase/recombinase XerD n=1 Tax=Methanococcus voltae PS TaxID=523842 RepID=A0ABT2EX49_METVO|nr:tyrosine-type recombinase/integrase [Methanococcus voltae]MCS3922001.1 integrase/recombinase XerD [Methanococcus voltae PS]
MKDTNINDLLMIKEKRKKKEKVGRSTQMEDWVDRYIEEREFDGIKQNTIKNDITRLRVYLRFCFETHHTKPEDMITEDFVKFFNYLEKERETSRNTQNRYFNFLKVFHRVFKLKNFKEFEIDSQDRKRFGKIEVKHYDAMTLDILNSIIEKIIQQNSRTKIRDITMLRLLWDTGCRHSEILNLTYGDCDLKKGEFLLRNTKGGKERKVVCSYETLKLLNYYVKHNLYNTPNSPLFQNDKSERVNNTWLGKAFREAVEELKKDGEIPQNKRIVIHSIRHGRAVDMLNKGVGIDIVKEYLGHRSIETTLFYSHSKERTEGMLKDLKDLL